ncbi:histidyl-tRNA synthase [Ralstonia solanacearum]|nr:histidyl-tRNA synthase [Ralstonia solanacearum]
MSKEPFQNAPSLEMRSYFSINYLAAAAHQARAAGRIEAEFRGFDAVASLEHKGAVTASIFMSVAAVEAYINEVFADCADGKTIQLQGLADAAVTRMSGAWRGAKSVERADIIEKYQLACMLADKPLMDLGRSPAQDLMVGIAIRNALMHYKPQTIELPMDDSKALATGDWKRVCDRLAGRTLKPSPFASSGQPDFPYRLLGHECAKWIVERAHAFLLEFAKHIGLIHPPFEHIAEQLATR